MSATAIARLTGLKANSLWQSLALLSEARSEFSLACVADR
jgi:hypothetical protein